MPASARSATRSTPPARRVASPCKSSPQGVLDPSRRCLKQIDPACPLPRQGIAVQVRPWIQQKRHKPLGDGGADLEARIVSIISVRRCSGVMPAAPGGTRPLQSTTSAGASTRADPRNACRGFVKQLLLDRCHADPDDQAEARHRTHPQESIKNHGRCSRWGRLPTGLLRQSQVLQPADDPPSSGQTIQPPTVLDALSVEHRCTRRPASATALPLGHFRTIFADVPIGTGCNKHCDPAALPLNRPSGLLLRWGQAGDQ